MMWLLARLGRNSLSWFDVILGAVFANLMGNGYYGTSIFLIVIGGVSTVVLHGIATAYDRKAADDRLNKFPKP